MNILQCCLYHAYLSTYLQIDPTLCIYNDLKFLIQSCIYIYVYIYIYMPARFGEGHHHHQGSPNPRTKTPLLKDVFLIMPRGESEDVCMIR